MGVPGIFEVFQLAIGPSTIFTTGAFRIGQAFREVLQSSPYRSGHRIIIELSGNFSKSGREYNSDKAVIAGLAGFTLDETRLKLKSFYDKIRENGYFTLAGELWPFNPESDLIFGDTEKKTAHENTIRFHLISEQGQPVFQAEYHSVGNGLVSGTGIPSAPAAFHRGSADSWSGILEILRTEKISPVEYVISGECAMHRISRDHFHKRMLVTWKLMMGNTESGMKTLENGHDLKDNFAKELYIKYLSQLSTGAAAGGSTRVAIYSVALADRIIENFPVITAPTCSGSSVLPAVFRWIQEKFMLPDEKMVEALTVSGLFGSLILNQVNQAVQPLNWMSEVAATAIMTAAGITFLTGGSLSDTEKAASMAASLYGTSPKTDVPFETRAFLLHNAMVAQTLPALTDLARIQPDHLTPGLDVVLKRLFNRQGIS